MINSGPARALAELAARAQEMLHAYEPGYETQDDQIRSATLARPKSTNDPLSVSAPEGAYFMGVDPSGKRFFSRDGSFHIAGDSIAWSDGSPVLGFGPNAEPGSAPTPLKVDSVDAALGRAADAHFEADGSVVYSRSVVDPKSGKSTVEKISVGSVALARFPAGTALPPLDGNRITQPPGVAAAIGKSGDAAFGPVAIKSRDVGSVDFEAGLNQLREAYLAVDAMSASDRVSDRDAHVAMDLIK
jgi:flagellar basal body rod protein FlgG